MRSDLDYAVIAVFLFTGAGLIVYAVSGEPRLAALVTGVVLAATGLGWLARWVRGGRG